MIKLNELINIEKLEYRWDVIENIPEFAILVTCQQNPKWHSEGNAWEHMKKVCEQAINTVKNENYNEKETLIFLAAALFHDIGKGVTTKLGKDGNWHDYNHEIEGEKITRYLLWNEGYEIREAICSLVRWHMEPLKAFDRKDYLEHIVYLSNCVYSLDMLIALKRCDVNGSIKEDRFETWKDNLTLQKLYMVAREMNCLKKPSYISNLAKVNKVYNPDKPYITAYVLIGLPGAGKTSATNFISASHYEIPYVISRDSIRAELGYCKEGEKIIGTEQQEHAVTVKFNMKMLEAVEKGYSIIIDNLNTKKKYRDDYKTILKDYNIIWYYVYVEADNLSKNIERRNGQIDAERFPNIIKSFEWPTPDEYNVIKYITT